MGEPHVRPWLQLSAKVESSNRRVSALERSVKALSPHNTVAEYDYLYHKSQMENLRLVIGAKVNSG